METFSVWRQYFSVQIFLLLLLLAGLACDSGHEGAKPQKPTQHLVVGLEANPTNLDPRRATDAASARVIQLVYSGLLRKDPQDNLVPDLALSWEQPEPNRYVFRLRPGVKFHHGRELTAEDVKYTFTSILDQGFASPRRGSYENLSRIEVPDKYTVIFHLKTPFAPFLTNLTLGIVPKDKADEDLSQKPVGSGPYRFLRWQSDERLELQAFADYFEGRPKTEYLTYRIIPEDTVRLLELEKGTLHLLQNSIPPDILPRLQANPKLKVSIAQGTSYAYVGFNLQDPLLRIKRIRQALTLAIDRPSIIDHILGGLASPASSLLPAGNWAYAPDLPEWGYDPKKAKRLLDEAGFPDPDGDGPQVRFTLSYKTSQNELARRIAEVLQDQWRKVGVGVDLRSYEWGTFFADIGAGNFQLYTLQWVGVTDPDIYYYIFHSSSVPPQGANRGHYINPELDKLLELGRTTVDLEQRKSIYYRVQHHLAEDVPYISLWHLQNVVAMRQEVQGFVLYPAGDFTSLKSVWWEPK